MFKCELQGHATPVVGLVDTALHTMRHLAVVVIGEQYKRQRARTTLLRQRCIVARQFEARRHPGIVVGGTLKIIVGVNLQIDFLLRHSGQRGNRVFDRHIEQRRNSQIQRKGDLLAFAETVAQGETFVLAHRDVRDFGESVFRLEDAVAGHRHNVDHHRRTQRLRARVRIKKTRTIRGRMTASAGHKGAVDDDCAAFDLAADEIRLGTYAHPHRLGAQALGRRRRRTRNRKRCQQIDAGARRRGIACAPALRPPVFRQHIGKTLDRHAQTPELIGHVLHALAVGDGAWETTPHLFIHRVAMLERNF